MRLHVIVIVIVFMFVPLASHAGIKAAPRASYLWSPMDFGDCVGGLL